MRTMVKQKLDNALQSVAGAKCSEAGRAWERLMEAKVEFLKEELVAAKIEKVPEIQGAIKELRQIMKQVKGTDVE